MLDKIKNLININDEETKLVQGKILKFENNNCNILAFMTSIKLIGLDIDYKSESELRKIISGVSPTYENLIFLTRLIEHANIHEKMFNSNFNKNKNYSNKLNINNNAPISKRDVVIENESFSCNYIECIPTVPNNEAYKDSSELFSFENLELEDLKKFNNEEENTEFNFSSQNVNKNEISEEANIDNNLNKKQIVDNEIINSIKIIENIIKNKREIFKEKVRLFPPEIKLREKKNYDLLKINCPAELLKDIEKRHLRRKNEIMEKLKSYENNMIKVDKKLEKLRNKVNENYELMDTEDYINLKKNLITFEKNIDNFLKDFNQLFSADIKYIPQEKFSNLHLYVEEFDIKNEKFFNLGKSIEEVFSFISKLIQ